jgi:hypothetical protein
VKDKRRESIKDSESMQSNVFEFCPAPWAQLTSFPVIIGLGWVEGFEPSFSRATTWRVRPLHYTHRQIGIFVMWHCNYSQNLSRIQTANAMMLSAGLIDS